PAFRLSNASPNDIAAGLNTAIQEVDAQHSYRRIVLVGHSIGALVTRKAFLYARGAAVDTKDPTGSPLPGRQPVGWASKVVRMVLLAGTNRGWDVSGQKPLDMGWGRHLQFWCGSALGKLTGTAGLARSMET